MNKFRVATQDIYLNKGSETMPSARANPKDSVACYADLEKEYLMGLNLKGIFFLSRYGRYRYSNDRVQRTR